MNKLLIALSGVLAIIGTAQAAVVGEEIDYRVGEVALQGYLAYDESVAGPRPGVLVVHEWWGHGEYARERARMLAELGYAAFALDMYGDGKYADHPDRAGEFASAVMRDMETARARFEAAMTVLREHSAADPDRTAAIGYCFGGAIVLNMARLGVPELDGVASFHGSLATSVPAQPGAVQARVLVLHGADDPLVPDEQVEAFRAEMDAAGVDYRFVAYPGVTHSFTNPEADANAERFGLPLAYDADADAQSWDELQTFLEQLFGS